MKFGSCTRAEAFRVGRTRRLRSMLKIEMRRYRCDILGITQVRCTGSGRNVWLSIYMVRIREKWEWSRFSLEQKNQDYIAAGNGRYQPVNPRIMVARCVAQHFNISVYSASLCTYISLQRGRDWFLYETSIWRSEKDIGGIEKKDVLIISGDWNANLKR